MPGFSITQLFGGSEKLESQNNSSKALARHTERDPITGIMNLFIMPATGRRIVVSLSVTKSDIWLAENFDPQ